MTGEWAAGGLVGWNEGTVSDSYFTGKVTSYKPYGSGLEEFLHSGAGGLVGCNYGSVSNSYSSANVTGEYGIGGLVGRNLDGTVSSSYSTGRVIGRWDVGGLIGSYEYSTVNNSYYNYDEVLINGENIITIGALFGEDFEQWLANDKFLDVNERLSQEDGYYLINDVSDFKELLAFGQDGLLKFRLKNDVDLATESDFYIPYLAGEFDGNGRKISNFRLSFDLVSPLGLFGYLAPGGKVTQVGVENINITGHSGVGGLVGGIWEGTVSHSYSTGSVNGNDVVGGLVGDSNFGIVSDSHCTANVTGYSVVGGLIGGNGGTVSNSYSAGNATGNSHIGGLVGSNARDVSNSYSNSSVNGDMHAGGLVGVNFGLGVVNNSYSTGSVTGDEYIGGLVGSNGDRGTVSNSYSTGGVTGDEHVGGLVGHNYFGTGEGTVSNCFWDTATSGQATSDGGTGKTTAKMKNIVTFSGAGWDIIAVANPGTRNPYYIWNIVDKQTYPFLSRQA